MSAPETLRLRLTIPLAPPDLGFKLPGGGSRWGGCEFLLNPPEDEPCDFWCVLGFAMPREAAWIAPENTLFMGGEPPAKKIFPTGFYRQFAHVVETYGVRHPRLEIGAPCTGWQAGRKLAVGPGESAYDVLLRMQCPAKENRVGVVCSATAKTPGQRRRLAFLAGLKERLGDRIVHFGRGFRPIDDKLDAILPYRFQLVLENSVSPNYWTEKLADAYLGWGFPLYAGCPNLTDYFAREAFEPLDLQDVEGAARTIEGLLARPADEGERAVIAEARRRVLDEHHVLMRCARLARRHYRPGEKRRVELRSYKAFRWPDRLGRWCGLLRD